jgi:hypothetical protein
MSRFLTFGLLASTILATAPLAAQAPSANRGDWIRNQTQNQQSQRAERRQERFDVRQGEARQPRQMQGEQRARPEVRQAAPERSVQSDVTTTRVPRSDAPRPTWQDRRGTDQSVADRAAREQPRNWNNTGRNNAEWQRNDQNRRDGERRADWQNRQRDEQARNAERDRQNARDRDNRAGNDRRWDNRRDNDWRRDDRARNSNDWNRQRQDWSQQRDWNYQRRLNERERWADQRRWDNRWRNDRRYDWNDYRSRYRNIYRMPTYRAPYGWNYGYRSFSIGIYLNNMLFSSSYWINDPYYYRLPPAYGSLRWVRYYDDALLVDIRDGYVVDVIRNFFW